MECRCDRWYIHAICSGIVALWIATSPRILHDMSMNKFGVAARLLSSNAPLCDQMTIRPPELGIERICEAVENVRIVT